MQRVGGVTRSTCQSALIHRHSALTPDLPLTLLLQVKEFQRFPLLREEIIKVVSHLLKERLPVANAMVDICVHTCKCVGWGGGGVGWGGVGVGWLGLQLSPRLLCRWRI